MNISFDELRDIKHRLPTGSVGRIAKELNITEQSVRNYFGANKFDQSNDLTGKHYQSGPNGGIVNLQDTTILDLALKILRENNHS